MPQDHALPVHKGRLGLLQIAVWENQRKMDSGEMRTFRTVTLRRSYRDKDGVWQDTSQLNVEDLGSAMKLMEDALDFAVKRDA